MKSFFREIVITLVLAVVIFLLLQTTVQSFVVIGSSMDPNLAEGERLIVNKVVYNLHSPERGDIVVFNPPNNQKADYVKRIIGLPGETVEVRDSAVYIDGNQLDEPYIKASPKYTLSPLVVPDNEYFMLGDNRNNSNDSHNGWTVDEESIIGKTWLAIWPPTRWQLFTTTPTILAN
ncbi:signal peptidase I [Chloroflexota bacterium]